MKYRATATNLIIIILLLNIFSEIENRNIPVSDICGDKVGKRLYLDFGERGLLEAKYDNNVFANRSVLERNITNNNECSLEFVTCLSCVVSINFRFFSVSGNCGKMSMLDVCGCENVWTYEPQYEDVSIQHFCGRFIHSNPSSWTYVSKTRRLRINFVYYNYYDHVFTLDYSSQRNKVVLNGQPTHGNMYNDSQVISSPYFPHFYPSDLNIEYTVSCKSAENCRINLIFTDFRISVESILEIFDWNGQRMYVATGNVFRPPVLVSSGPSMVVRFYANGGSNRGYKAVYTYIDNDFDNAIWKPNTNCGGYVTNLGGGITMMNMVENGTRTFDCIWIIRPPNNYMHMKTHLYVKVATFVDLEAGSELRIHSGVTSNDPAAEVLRNTVSQFISYKAKEHIVPLSQGFYIRLRAGFRPGSRLAIVYSAFNYKDCFAGSDFLCNNLRCISAHLRCDGLDHCGDNSDESKTCLDGIHNRLLWSKRPNFLFQRIERYDDLSAATFIFLACSIGLIGLIFSMAILAYRVNAREQHHRRIQDHIETIHAILEESVLNVEEEIITPDEPPVYEAPPDYKDVGKLLALRKNEISDLKNKTVNQRRKSDEPPDISPNTLTPRKQENSEDVSHSSNSVNRACQTAPAIPHSPPPAYTSGNNIFPVCCKRDSNLQIVDQRCKSFTSATKETSRDTNHFSCSNRPAKTTLNKDIRLVLEEETIELVLNSRQLISPKARTVARCRYFSDSQLIYLYSSNDSEMNIEDNKTFKIKSYSSDDVTYRSE